MFATFLINLDKDVERLAYMDEQLSSLNIKYRRQSAVLGHDYKPTIEEYNEKLAIKKGKHALLPGEIGCALSHVAIIATIVKEKIPHTLILEDDVVLPHNFKEIVENEIYQNTGQWEYLLFDYPAAGLVYIKKWFDSIFENYKKSATDNIFSRLHFIVYSFLKGIYIPPLSLFEGVQNHYKHQYPGPVHFYRPVSFAGTYLVSNAGAKKLLSLTNPVIYTADQLPNQARIKCGLRFMCFSSCSDTR